jgi:hypothetical protein
VEVKYFILLFLTCLSLCLSQAILAQTSAADPPVEAGVIPSEPPAPPSNVRVSDLPNDDGHGIQVKWDLSPDDGAGARSVISYDIYRALSPDAPDSLWKKTETVVLGTKTYADKGEREPGSGSYLPKRTDLYYRVYAVGAGVRSAAAAAGPVQATDDWFNSMKVPELVFCLVFLVLTVRFINMAKKGIDLYVRPLAGIEAIDEAIGRATEMGKPILYVLGIGTAGDIATIASFTVLGRVARKVAEYQTSMIVPCCDPVVMTVAQEIVKSGYADAGRPDAYNEDSVYYVTSQQFPFVAAVNGTILREKPATNIYLGYFAAESLLLAETGVLAGSIQIAGTDQVSQLPFFVVACDYTLLGEELYAASAYLGREPLLLGTLKAQDYLKAIVLVCMVALLALRMITGADVISKPFDAPWW